MRTSSRRTIISTPEPYRLTDYAAYYRLVKRRLEAAIDCGAAETYPEPVQQCEICAWWGAVRLAASRGRSPHAS